MLKRVHSIPDYTNEPWKTKTTPQEKEDKNKRAEKKRRENNPTPKDFKSEEDVLRWCIKKRKTSNATTRMIGLYNGTITDCDPRDPW